MREVYRFQRDRPKAIGLQPSLRGLAFGKYESKNQQSPSGEQSQTPGSFGTKAPGVTLRSVISKHLQNESCTFECI